MRSCPPRPRPQERRQRTTLASQPRVAPMAHAYFSVSSLPAYLLLSVSVHIVVAICTGAAHCEKHSRGECLEKRPSMPRPAHCDADLLAATAAECDLGGQTPRGLTVRFPLPSGRYPARRPHLQRHHPLRDGEGCCGALEHSVYAEGEPTFLQVRACMPPPHHMHVSPDAQKKVI